MSEETLTAFLERINTDEAFRKNLNDNWQTAIKDLDISPAELTAVATQDEDALRRLVGSEVGAFAAAGQANFYTTNLLCSLACFTTIDTPHSGRHCGTHTPCQGTVHKALPQ